MRNARDRDHKRYHARNPHGSTSKVEPGPLRTFGEWWENRASEQDWRIASWEYDEPASRDAVLALGEETGDRKFDRYVGTRRRGDLYEGATVLDVMVRQLRSKELLLSSFNWWYARHGSGTRNRVWKEYPHIWFGEPSRRRCTCAAGDESGDLQGRGRIAQQRADRG